MEARDEHERLENGNLPRDVPALTLEALGLIALIDKVFGPECSVSVPLDDCDI